MPAQAAKIYFASDLHLGAPNLGESQRREKRFLQWIDRIVAPDATALYILGDLFDFWFEYKTVVPRGFVRTLGRLADLSDTGLPIHFFTGNHDLWMFGYFEQELGIKVHHQPLLTTIEGKTLLVGHGDGLGPHDIKYKWLKKHLFTNRFCQTLLQWLHPDIGVGIAKHFSHRSRLANGNSDEHFLGNDQEWLVQYAQRKLQQQAIDFFVFGHRHLPLQIPLHNSLYINTGDWIKYHSYAIYHQQSMQLCHFGPTS